MPATPVSLALETGAVAGLLWQADTGSDLRTRLLDPQNDEGAPERTAEELPHLFLALHGWLDNAASFSFLAPQLVSRGYGVLALDLPGHGFSSHQPAGGQYHLLDQVYWIRLLIEALRWPADRLHLLGHSLGGVLSTLYRAANAEDHATLTLIDSVGPLSAAPEKTADNLRRAFERRVDSRASIPRIYSNLDEAAELRTRGLGGLRLESARLLMERSLKQTARGWEWCSDSRLRWPSFSRMTEEQILDLLQAVEGPVLLLLGKQGFFPHRKTAERRFDALAPQQIVWLEGPHHLHMDGDIDACGRVICDFVEQNACQ